MNCTRLSGAEFSSSDLVLIILIGGVKRLTYEPKYAPISVAGIKNEWLLGDGTRVRENESIAKQSFSYETKKESIKNNYVTLFFLANLLTSLKRRFTQKIFQFKIIPKQRNSLDYLKEATILSRGKNQNC